MGTIHGIATALLVILFLGVVWWAYHPQKKKDFDEAARLALDEEDNEPQSGSDRDQNKRNEDKRHE